MTDGEDALYTDGRTRGAVVQEVCEHVREGLDVTSACGLAMVPYRTIRTWMQRYEWVQLRIDHARGTDARELVLALRDAAAADAGNATKRAMWELERKHPLGWGSRAALEVSGPEGGAQEHAITITLAEAERIAAESDEDE